MNPNPEMVDPSLNTLVEFLYNLRLIYFCAYFAYDGLKNGISLTHAGIKKGALARIYGVLYVLVSLITLICLPGMAADVWSVPLAEYWKAFTYGRPSIESAILWFGIAGFMAGIMGLAFLLNKLRKKPGTKINQGNPKAMVILYWMLALPAAFGIQALLGLPGFFYVAIAFTFTFFSPLTSPRALKKILPAP